MPIYKQKTKEEKLAKKTKCFAFISIIVSAVLITIALVTSRCSITSFKSECWALQMTVALSGITILLLLAIAASERSNQLFCKSKISQQYWCCITGNPSWMDHGRDGKILQDFARRYLKTEQSKCKTDHKEAEWTRNKDTNKVWEVLQEQPPPCDIWFDLRFVQQWDLELHLWSFHSSSCYPFLHYPKPASLPYAPLSSLHTLFYQLLPAFKVRLTILYILGYLHQIWSPYTW